MSATIKMAAPVGDCFHECVHQQDIDHRDFIQNQQVTIERVVLGTFEAAAPWDQLPAIGQSSWASKPAASVMRLAPRPIKALSMSFTPLTASGRGGRPQDTGISDREGTLVTGGFIQEGRHRCSSE